MGECLQRPSLAMHIGVQFRNKRYFALEYYRKVYTDWLTTMSFNKTSTKNSKQVASLLDGSVFIP